MSPGIAAVRRLRRPFERLPAAAAARPKPRSGSNGRPLPRGADILAGSEPDTGWLPDPRLGRSLERFPFRLNTLPASLVRSAFAGQLERESNPRQLDYESSALPN